MACYGTQHLSSYKQNSGHGPVKSFARPHLFFLHMPSAGPASVELMCASLPLATRSFRQPGAQPCLFNHKAVFMAMHENDD
jgi:hypothetical protein